MSAVPRVGRTPHWVSGKMLSDSGCSRLSKTLARIFPATDSKEIPRKSPQSAMSPFLKMVTIMASFKSCGISSVFQIFRKRCCSWCVKISLPCLYISLGMPSLSEALFFIWKMALRNSSRRGSSSSSVLIGE